MDKDLALEILGLDDYEGLTAEMIDKKVGQLSKQYNPEYEPETAYELVMHKPDQDKYNKVVEAGKQSKQYVQNRNVLKAKNNYIDGTNVLKPRNQENGEKASDYLDYLKDYYENIIIDQNKVINNLNDQQASKADNEEKVTAIEKESAVKAQVSPSSDIDDLLNSITDSTLPVEEETLDDEFDKEINKNHETSIADMDEAIEHSENDIPTETLDSIETPVEKPIVEEPAAVEPIVEEDSSNKVIDQEPYIAPTKNEVANEQLNSVLAKLTDGVNYNTATAIANKCKAKCIQVTKSFVTYLKDADAKYKLKKQENKVKKVPTFYFNQVGQKIKNLKVNNQEIVKENLKNLSLDELNVLKDEYYKNGLSNFDDVTKKAIESYVLKTQKANAVDLDEIIQNEKDELMGANDKIVALHSMADVLINNEPQKAVYENLIQQQYNGAAEKIKDLREKEANLNNINTKEDDKGNFFENIINKLPFGHKEKTDEHSSEYQLLDEHKKSLAKLKEFEQKAILEHNDAKALKAFGAVEEQQAIINEEEEKLMGNGKSL